MLLGLSQSEVEEWNHSLHTYQKAKRTKRPFGSIQPSADRKAVLDVRERQMKYNPVLQSFRDVREQSKTIQHEEIQKASEYIKHLKNNYKYATDYDIITFNQSLALPHSQSRVHEVRKKEHRDPSYQGYNIINGKSYRQDYLSQVGYKPVRHHDRNIHPEEGRAYNIINGRYGVNNDDQYEKEQQQNNQEILSKSQEFRVYDSVNGKYYNPEQEEQYQKRRKEEQLAHTLKPKKKLPPSYVNRQIYIQGENDEVPDILKTLDAKRQLSKKRYKMRYLVDKQYQTRNNYLTEKKDLQARNRVHNGRILEQKGKQFNIINSQRYDQLRAEQLFGKEATGSPYQLRPLQSPIKQHGFSTIQQ